MGINLPVHRVNDIKEVDGASEVLDIGLALLQVERVEAPLLFRKT